MNLGTSIGSEASASFSSGIDPNMTRKEVGESMKRAFHKIFSACRNLDNLPREWSSSALPLTSSSFQHRRQAAVYGEVS